MEILFATAHGTYQLDGITSGTVEDLLRTSGIPTNAVSIYGFSDASADGELTAALKFPIKDLHAKYAKVVIRPDRNIDYQGVSLRDVIVSRTDNPVCEYAFLGKQGREVIYKYFSDVECLEYVIECISQFCDLADPVADRPVVVGVSGGGDSNALLTGLVECGRFARSQIIPVMMLGIPDWDLGRKRAESQCANLGLQLTIVDSCEVNRLLGRAPESADWLGDFEAIYPDSDLEVVGTLAVRLALSAVARRVGAQAAITGLNMEDILAECMLATMRGEPPLPFPIRRLDDVTFWYPIYRCPKKIIDGCYPKLSLQNYADRYPSYMYWRAAAYHFAQQVGCAQIGMEFNLLDGFEVLSKTSNRSAIYDPKIGFCVAADLKPDDVKKWRKFTPGNSRVNLQSIT